MQYTPTISQPASSLQQANQPRYEITDADRKRIERIQRARQAYDGELEPPLKKMPDQTDPNVMDNVCSSAVEGGLSFLFGDEIEITLEEEAPPDAQDMLDDSWGEKEARIPLLQELAINGAIAGQAFLRIVPLNDGSFRLIAVDPSTLYVKTAPQDCKTVFLYCIEYCTDEKINGRPQRVYYREEIERIDPQMDDPDTRDVMHDPDTTWQMQHWTRIGDRGAWMADGAPIKWAYPFPPLFSCQNLVNPNEFWGKPDITRDLIEINNAINFALSNINLIGKLYGHPFLFVGGLGNTVLDTTPGRIIQLPLPENKIQSVPITSDLANMLIFVDKLYEAAERLTAVPSMAMGLTSQMQRGAISGLAIKMMCLALLKKTDKKRCLYGKLILDVSEALLILNNYSPDIKITIGWQSPLPADSLADLQASVLKLQIGVSEATTLREQGYDPDEEAELKKAEAAEKMNAWTQGQGMAPAPSPGQPPMMQQPMQGQTQQQQGGQA